MLVKTRKDPIATVVKAGTELAIIGIENDKPDIGALRRTMLIPKAFFAERRLRSARVAIENGSNGINNSEYVLPKASRADLRVVSTAVNNAEEDLRYAREERLEDLFYMAERSSITLTSAVYGSLNIVTGVIEGRPIYIAAGLIANAIGVVFNEALVRFRASRRGEERPPIINPFGDVRAAKKTLYLAQRGIVTGYEDAACGVGVKESALRKAVRNARRKVAVGATISALAMPTLTETRDK